jgi:hypothetical protein
MTKIVELPSDVDGRSKRGRELAARLNKQTVLDNMPKVYFVEDSYNGGYRVGRTDWAPDAFNIVPKAEFETFRKVYERLSMPLLDKTYDED